jgi:hypothetical protein
LPTSTEFFKQNGDGTDFTRPAMQEAAIFAASGAAFSWYVSTLEMEFLNFKLFVDIVRTFSYIDKEQRR